MSSRWAARTPLRIDLFDDEIEAIRRFDPETQRSLDALPAVRLLPAREVPLDAQAVKEFRRRYRTRFEGDPTKSAIYRGVSEGLAPAGVEFYQPLFFDSTATLFDYLPADTVLVQRRGAARARSITAWSEVAGRYEERRHDIERPVLAPAELFVPPPELLGALERFAGVTLDAFKADTELSGALAGVRNFPTSAPRELRVDVRAEQPFAPLDAFLKAFDGRVLHRGRFGRATRGAAGDAARPRARGERRRRLGELRQRAARAWRSPWRRTWRDSRSAAR